MVGQGMIGRTELDERKHLLEGQLLFRNVGLESIEPYLEELREVRLADGEVLLTPGQQNAFIYMLVAGRLQVYLETLEYPPLLTLDPGECVGEMSLVDHGSTSAYVTAEGECRLLAMGRDTVWAMVNNSHGVARNLLYVLSRRVRFDNAAIVSGLETEQQWRHYATVDALTGLHNRRWLDDAFPRQMERCRLAAIPFSVVMLDVDHFKHYNDTFGHLVGDQALASVAALLNEHLRPNDMAARFGGEEFLVLLPGSGLTDAVGIAERLRQVVAERSGVVTDTGLLDPVTISLGVAEMEEGEAASELLGAVDIALYEAKEEGRNRVASRKPVTRGT